MKSWVKKFWRIQGFRSLPPTTWPKQRKRLSTRRGETEHVYPDQPVHARHHAGNNRQDRPIPHSHVPRLRKRPAFFRGRRQPEKGGRGLRRHSHLWFGEGCQGA